MTRKQVLLAAIGDVLEEAATLTSWMDDTAYPRQSRRSWDDAIDRLKREYSREVPQTLRSVESKA
jgi:signal recognition particle subunit SEC65